MRWDWGREEMKTHKCPLRGSELSECDHNESEKNRGSEEHGDDDCCDGTWPQHNWKQKYHTPEDQLGMKQSAFYDRPHIMT